VWLVKGSRGRKPWQQVSPPWQPAMHFFPPTFYVPFEKHSLFRVRHRHASFAGNRFPCVKSADEFPASFPPLDPSQAFVFDGPAHLFVLGFYKMVHSIRMQNISIHHVTKGNVISLITRIKRFSMNKLIKIFEVLTFFSPFLKHFFRKERRRMKKSTETWSIC